MSNLAIIPARGGSKGVPNKNIKLIAGKPLIQYTIDVCKNVNIFDEIHVSTDSTDIANVVHDLGINIEQLRPSYLAEDDTPMLEVIRYIINSYKEKNKFFNKIFLLQPTAPLRTEQDILLANEKFIDCDSLISVKRVPSHYNPHWVFQRKDDQFIQLFTKDDQPIARRQDLPTTYIREGSIYIFKPETIEKYGNIYGDNIKFIEIKHDTVNIDHEEDVLKAIKLLNVK